MKTLIIMIIAGIALSQPGTSQVLRPNENVEVVRGCMISKEHSVFVFNC